MNKDHVVDGLKASPLGAYAGAWLAGWTINEWAALAALIYSLILIFDKLNKMGLFRWIGRRLGLHR